MEKYQEWREETINSFPLLPTPSFLEISIPECGSHHDRDINASINILAAGLAVSAPVAHGGNPQDPAGLSVERL
ncbi:hypothetical protein AFK68_30410 [Hydrocoleum sp. CS-953]|uniref:hypothetical protein n=1 Tax=Hydrocoleum sp. CS-953 TaxID=1671698 RepID=UPI000BCAACB8|nr:hypothetical protein AFK68_30410 [Hydrocoleum sp. CS-953]